MWECDEAVNSLGQNPESPQDGIRHQVTAEGQKSGNSHDLSVKG